MYQVEFDKTKRLFGEYEKAIGIAVEFDKNTNLIEAINFYNKSLEISDKLLALPHNHYSKAIEAKNQSVQKRIIELMNLQQQQDPNQNQQENAQNPPISLNTQQNNVIQYVDQPKAGLNNEFQHRIYLNLQKINLQNQQMPYRNPPKTTIPNMNQQQLVDECQNNETPNQQIIIETPPKTDIHCNYQHQVPYNTSANRVSSQAQQNKQKPIHNETPPMTEIPMQNQQKPMYNQSKNENQIQYRQKSYSRYQQNPIEIPPKAEIPKQNQPKPAKTTPKPENTNQNQQDITANLPNQDTPLQSQQKPQKNQLKNENPTQNQQRPFKKTIKPENQIKSESSSTNSVLKKNKLRPDLIRRNKATQDQITNENSQTKIPNTQDQINSETTQNNKTKSRIKNSNSYLEKTENNSSQKSKFQKIVESDPSSFIKPPGTNYESQTSIKEASTEINESNNDQIIPQISTINNQGRRRSKSTRAQRKNNQLGFTRPKHYQSKKLYVPPLLSNRIEQYESFTFDFLLGKGSFGSVYLVTRKDDGAKYALKKIESPILSDLNEKQLVREIELMNLANHPLVCHLRGFSFICELNKGRPPFIVTDYYPNGSLNQVVSGFKKFTPTQKLIALYGIANAMSYLHSIGIVHRDLKPENVLLDKADHPIVCDFGLSKLMEDSKARQTGAAGSPVYMAPELIWRQDYTNSIDVYAYAYVCYELLTETLAFSDVQSIPELVDLVCNKHKRPPLDGFDDGVLPMAFRKFISLCWNDDPTKRPSFKEIVSLFVKGKLRISGVDENIFNDFVNSIPRY